MIFFFTGMPISDLFISCSKKETMFTSRQTDRQHKNH
ncbi:hypothetical protein SAMN05880574_103134 [Chryseobacterium sp. RU37D]|nr:hypothetical protein SAMN05880574_103134 [Chryseobacterium sp. RU37D]